VNANDPFDNTPATMGGDSGDPFSSSGGGGGGLPGGQSAFAPMGGAMPKRSVSSQTIILVVIAVVAGGLLFGMRKFGMGPVKTLTEVKIDYEPNHETEAERVEAVEVMDTLARSSTPTQIPQSWIERDPFILSDDYVPVDSSGTTSVVDDGAIREAEIRGKVHAAAETVEIQSVMGGRVPLARVSGETMKIGDKVDDVLELVAIEGRAAIFKGIDGRYYKAETGEALEEYEPEEPIGSGESE